MLIVYLVRLNQCNRSPNARLGGPAERQLAIVSVWYSTSRTADRGQYLRRWNVVSSRAFVSTFNFDDEGESVASTLVESVRLLLCVSDLSRATVVTYQLHEPGWLPPVDAAALVEKQEEASMQAKLPTIINHSDREVVLPSAILDDSVPHNRHDTVLGGDIQIATASEDGSSHGVSLGKPAEEKDQNDSSAEDPHVSNMPRISRRNAIVPTENTLFAGLSGRSESINHSPRAEDTMVTPLEPSIVIEPVTQKFRSDDVPSASTSPSRGSQNLDRAPSSRQPPDKRETPFTNLQSPEASIIAGGERNQDPDGYVTKSSASPSPRRNSFGRLLGTVPSMKSRIHPVTTYAPSLSVGVDHSEVLMQREPNSHGKTLQSALENSSSTLVTQTVQIAERKPTVHPKSSSHTQREIYKMTQASLAHHFGKQSELRNGRLVHRVIFVCIIINVSVLAFETCDGKNRGSSAPGYPFLPDQSVYKAIESFFSVIFSIEFVGRTVARQNKREVLSDPITWIDVVSLGPWYLQLFLKLGGQNFNLDAYDSFAHKLGLLRLLRILRLGIILRRYESMRILVASLRTSVAPLMVTMFFLFTLVMLLATAIFYADPCYNFNTCPFTDIFNSAYFIMVTVATVGYGNQVPSSNNVIALGIAFIAMVFGQLYLAMPLTIVGNNFQDAYEGYQQSKRRKLKRNDTTLTPFDSVKLDRKSQRLCDIQYHLLESWRIVQLNIDKMLKIGNELSEMGGNTKDSTRSMMAGQVQRVEALVEAQITRLSKIMEAVGKLAEVHSEVCTLLQAFVPHKRRPHAEVVAIASGGDSMLSRVFEKARKAMANRFGSHKHDPDPRVLSNSHRGRLWLALEVPDSSQIATAINRVMMGFALLSVWIFFCESLPELASNGPETPACQRVVKAYCKAKGFALPDSGCFVRSFNNSVDWKARLDFTCSHATEASTCYGNGVNFGSLNPSALPCVEAFDRTGVDLICFRMQCIASTGKIVNMEPYWIYFEWLFGLSFLAEMVLRFYACNDRRRFFHDVYNIFDILAVLPFGFELCDYMFFGVKPTYTIESTAPSFFSAIRVLKTMRILKLTRHFRGTKVLAQTAKETWRQLLIPIFFLLTLCILAAAVYFEIERGTQCFVGSPCIWWHKDLMTPQLVAGHPFGKRILIQDTRPTIITDMLRSTWLSAATFTTVGYGDVRPRTAMGRMFTIGIAVVGTMYTAMPIFLVGEKFRALYARHAEKIVIRRGGSSTSWTTRRNLVSRLSHTVRERDSINEHVETSLSPLLFKLEEEELEQLRQFQSLKRVFQNIQRQIDNLQEVNRDILRGLHPKRMSLANINLETVSVSSNVFRRSAAMELAIHEKGIGILDSILAFSSLVEKLQDAPPFYEAFLPEGTTSLQFHRGSAIDSLFPPEIQNRLLHTNPSEVS